MANIVPTPKPATREIGVETNLHYGSTAPSLGMGWGHFIQEGEHVPELQWPQSILWYEQMLYADSMINQMWLSLVMPLSEYVWAINPNGADAALTAKLAADLGLPVGLPEQDTEDEYTIQPGLFTFNFLQHIEEALLAVPFGHYFFEKVGVIASDGLFHLKTLAARHPATIMEMAIDESGVLSYVRQYTGRDGGVQPEPIPADHLVPYVWRGDARARWIGRSMLRPIYRNWLIRDILIRVDAINHERAGGVPGIETDDTFQGTSLQDLQALAASFRVGEDAGYALPPGAKLVLNKLGGTDVVASLTYHDNQIAGQWRSMVEQLGQTATGNRALGQTFAGLQDIAQRALARWFSGQFRESVIRYWWEQNVPTATDGTLPVHPLLAWRPPKGSATDPVAPVAPPSPAHEAPATDVQPTPTAPPTGGPAPPPVAAAGREPSPRRSIGGAAYEEALGRDRRGGLGSGSGPNGGVPTPGSAGATRPEEALASPTAAARSVPTTPTLPASAAAPQEDGAQGTEALPPLSLPPRQMRRQPYDHEIRARTDFAALEIRHDTAEQQALTLVTSQWLPALKQELAEKIAALGDNPSPAKLAAITLTPPDSEALHTILLDVATSAADDAGAELAAQSVAVKEAKETALKSLIRGQADAMARQVASGVTLAGTRRAVQIANPSVDSSGEEIARGVADYLGGLAHRWEQDQVRGAVSQAVNAGRFARFQQITQPATFYASELLDDATCLHPDALITTVGGIRRAADITPDDALLTHAGTYEYPSRITVSDIEEELIALRIASRTLRLTADHPVLALEGGEFTWRNAGQLAVGALIVSEQTVERSPEVGAHDDAFTDAPDDEAARFKIAGLARVGGGAQCVPVVAIGFDGESVEQEVHDPRADLCLTTMGDEAILQEFAYAALDTRLGVGCDVATAGAVTDATLGGWDDAEGRPARNAVDVDGGPSAGFGAVAASAAMADPEGSAAALAVRSASAMLTGASEGTVVVAGGLRCGDRELDTAADADLRDAVEGATWTRGRISVTAFTGAVDGARPAPPGDLAPASPTRPRRLAYVLPAREGGATPTATGPGGGGPAVRTRRLHKYIVVERVTAKAREEYAGPIYDFTLPNAHTFWAEGVLVHNCDECAAIDGTEYGTLDEATADYPGGGYIDCAGGPRCRGTVVAVAGSEL